MCHKGSNTRSVAQKVQRNVLTNRKHCVWGGYLIGLFGYCLHASPVSACSASICFPDQFVPREGKLPANAAAIAVQPSFRPAMRDAGLPQVWPLLCTDDVGANHEIEVQIQSQGTELSWLVPTTNLIPGEYCVIQGTDCDRSDPQQWLLLQPDEFDLSYLSSKAEFQVTEEAPLPTKLGELEVTTAAADTLELWSNKGGCTDLVDVCRVHATLALDTQAEAWKDALVYSSIVDGEPWDAGHFLFLPAMFGGSYVGRGREIVFSFDTSQHSEISQYALAPGKHTLQMRASLPGTQLMLETAEVELALDCPSSADSKSNTAQTGGSASSSDAAVDMRDIMDSSMPTNANMDAAQTSDSSPLPETGAATSTNNGRMSGGGLCAVGPRGAAGGTPKGWLILSVLGVLGTLAQRRRA